MENEEQGAQQAPEGPAMIERSKFDRVVEAKKGLERQLAEAREANQSLEERVSSVDSLAKRLEAAEQAAQAAESRFSRYQTISSAVGSTDSDVIDAFEWQYGRLQGDDRPDLGEWIKGLRAQPEAAPAVLRHWLGGQEKPTQEPKAAPRPSPSAGHRQPPGGESAYSSAELRGIRQEAMITGDWSKWAQVRKAMGLPD